MATEHTLDDKSLRITRFEAKQVEAARDATRRTPGSVVSTALILVGVGILPFIPGSQSVVGQTRGAVSLAATAACLGLWLTNSFLYRRERREGFYAKTQDLELMLMKGLFFVLIVDGGDAFSFMWLAMPITAIYWAYLRPSRLRRHLWMGFVLHAAAALGFLVQSSSWGVAMSLADGALFSVVLVVAHRRALLALDALSAHPTKEALLDPAARAAEHARSRLGDLANALESAAVAEAKEASQLKAHEDSLAERARLASRAASGDEEAIPTASAMAQALRRRCAPLFPEGVMTFEAVLEQPPEAPGRSDELWSLPITPSAAHATLRSAQELCQNIVKHANSRRAHLRLLLLHDAGQPTGISLNVWDDGEGLPPERFEGSERGLRNVQERAAELHGSARLLSPDAAAGWTTRIEVQVPLSPRAL